MNINITPSAVAVDTAANLLAFLEMAREPDKLKAVLDQIKSAQTAAAAEAASAQELKADALKTSKAVQAQADQAAQDAAAAREATARASQAMAEAQSMSDHMRQERQAFDGWMAAEREKLAADRAKVASDAAANAAYAHNLKEMLGSAEAKMAEAAAEMQAAEALREEYKQKISALKSMI